MRLAEIPTRLIEDTLRKWRRRAIAAAVIAVCALVAFVEGLAAARMALEGVLGPVGGRLVLVAVSVAILAGAAFVLGRIEAQAERPSAGEQPGREERVSLIAEAINLGYTIAQDLKKPSAHPTADESPVDDRPSDRSARRRNGTPRPGSHAADG
jgi:hypothetical protein